MAKNPCRSMPVTTMWHRVKRGRAAPGAASDRIEAVRLVIAGTATIVRVRIGGREDPQGALRGRPVAEEAVERRAIGAHPRDAVVMKAVVRADTVAVANRVAQVPVRDVDGKDVKTALAVPSSAVARVKGETSGDPEEIRIRARRARCHPYAIRLMTMTSRDR